MAAIALGTEQSEMAMTSGGGMVSSGMAPNWRHFNCNTRAQGRRSKDTHPRCPSLLFVEAAKA